MEVLTKSLPFDQSTMFIGLTFYRCLIYQSFFFDGGTSGPHLDSICSTVFMFLCDISAVHFFFNKTNT